MEFDKDGKPIIDGKPKGTEGGEGGDGKPKGTEGGEGGDGKPKGTEGGEGGDGKPKGTEGGEGGDGKPKGTEGGEGGDDDKQFEALKFGEGAKIDESAKKEFIEHCKKNGIKAEAAQGFIDLQTKINAEVAKGQEALRTNAIEAWQTQVKKEYGVEYEKKLAAGKKALDVFGNENLKELLGDKGENGTGLGNHPAVVAFLVKIGETLQNDKFIPGGQGSVSLENRTPEEKARSLYGDTMK